MRPVRLQCQQVLLNNLQCPYPTFRDRKICRWHRISQEFRADFRTKGRLFANAGMLGVGATLMTVGTFLWNYSKTPDVLWLLTASWSLGWAVMLFADAIMALDYPLSHLTIWPRLMTASMAGAIAGGVVVHLSVTSRPEASLPVIRTVLGQSIGELYAPAVFASVAIVSAAFLLLMLLKRILYFDLPNLGAVGVWPVTMLMVASAFRPALQQVGVVPNPQQVEGFWEVVLGNRVGVTLAVTQFIAFNVCELVNVRIRRARCDSRLFQKTIWPSFPVCMLSPFLAMVASRFVLVLVGVKGTFAFGVLTVGLSIPACIVSTGWVIRHAVNARKLELSLEQTNEEPDHMDYP